MPWWFWIAGGLALLALEVTLSGDFYLLFFGCGALLTGLLTLVGVEVPLPVEVLVFAGLSLLSLFLFRRPLIARLRGEGDSRKVDSMIGEAAVAMGEIAPGSVGKAEMRGTSWMAGNGGSTKLADGQRCRVEKVVGLTIWIKAEEGD